MIQSRDEAANLFAECDAKERKIQQEKQRLTKELEEVTKLKVDAQQYLTRGMTGGEERFIKTHHGFVRAESKGNICAVEVLRVHDATVEPQAI